MATPVDPPEFINNFWEMFGDDSDFIEVVCEESRNLINDILDTYGIQADSTTSLGGTLKNLDIKRMDAITIINLALLEGSGTQGNILEWTINEDGQFEVIEIGTSGGNLSPIYYELQSGAYREPCVGVMLTGAKPVITPKQLVWKYIWGTDADKHVYDTSQMVNNCAKKDFSSHAIIVYNDPHLDSKYEDGINNFYEIDETNPYDIIVGYARALSVPGYTEDQLKDTDIKEHGTSVIPIIVTGSQTEIGTADLGTLIERQSAPDDPTTETDDNCWTSQEGIDLADFDQGVKIPLPDSLIYEDVRNTEVSKYVRVEAVFVVGRKFTFLQSIPKTPEATRETPTADNSLLVGTIDDIVAGTYRLEEGTHYTITYDPEAERKEPYIVFAKNSRPNEPHNFGKGQEFSLMPGCELAQTSYGEGLHTGSILPVAENKGFLVDQIIAMVHLDTPSISVYDPEWNDTEAGRTKAIEIAHALEYKMAAIVMEEKPAPIAFCAGSTARILEQHDTKVDNDPTTKQNFEDTPIEEAMDIMESGPGISLSLSFIEDEDALKELAEVLFDFMNTSDSSPIETTYICGPEASPKLGVAGQNGGIINSINYSYTDSGSYTISATEGPWLAGNLTSVNTTSNMKMTETVSARGKIIESLGNNLFFKIKIDGYGDRVAINTAPNVLRVGDVVTCTIHNNPVEA